MFYGATVAPGKATAFVPPPDDWNLHLSQAALPADATSQRVSLLAKLREEEPVVLCTLTAAAPTAALDLFFDEYVEFSVKVRA